MGARMQLTYREVIGVYGEPNYGAAKAGFLGLTTLLSPKLRSLKSL
jgi:hypothetical protein